MHFFKSRSNALSRNDPEHLASPANAGPNPEAEADALSSKEQGDDRSASEEIKFPRGAKLTTITLALALTVFLIALDNTIITTAIPRITDELDSLDDVGWYGSAYFLTTCAFQLLYGKFYTFLSIKWVYLSSIAIFELGSLICGAAPTSTALIVGRAVAGLGSAGIFSGALVIVARTVPMSKRPVYSGLLGACYGISSVAGPLMGGAFTDHATWRWCFYINLPIGAISFGVVALFFQSPSNRNEGSVGFKARLQQFDPLGTAIFVPAIICLLLALQWGGTMYAWSSARIIALLVLSVLLVLAFIGEQIWKGDSATIPPRILCKRSIACGAWFGICLGSSFFAITYYIPIWFQAIKGDSAVDSGIKNLPMILGVVIVIMMTGGLTTAIGYYTPFMIVSSVVAAIGAGLLSTLKTDSGSPMWIGYQALFGFGIGFGLQQPIIAAQTVLGIDDVATGTALMAFSQTLGGAVTVSICQNVFSNRLTAALVKVVPEVDPAQVLSAGATSLTATVPTMYLGEAKVAYNSALTQTFYVSVAFSCLSLIGSAGMEWKSVKGKKPLGPGGA